MKVALEIGKSRVSIFWPDSPFQKMLETLIIVFNGQNTLLRMYFMTLRVSSRTSLYQPCSTNTWFWILIRFQKIYVKTPLGCNSSLIHFTRYKPVLQDLRHSQHLNSRKMSKICGARKVIDWNSMCYWCSNPTQKSFWLNLHFIKQKDAEQKLKQF